jgi:two-component system chemotaxis sensor kinase CheA
LSSAGPAGGDADVGIDMSQFHAVFFEEAAENLDNMERMLLEIDVAAADDEQLNAIFRCAHSVKGGAAAFGFNDVAELTHQMETLLDKLRRHELAPTAPMVDALLQAGDLLRAQLSVHQGVSDGEVDTRETLALIRSLAAGPGLAARPVVPPPAPAPVVAGAARRLLLTIGPLARPQDADDVVELFRDMPDLGRIEALPDDAAAAGRRSFALTTTSSDADLLDLLTFHVARELLHIGPLPSDAPPHAAAAELAVPAADVPPAAARPAPAPARVDAKAGGDAATLRVAIEKVDQLINLVGELIIAQAVVVQATGSAELARNEALSAGLADLDRSTRGLQEAVLSIRMIPMSTVFSRFPRTLRDLSAKLGKKLELVTLGEATELDKSMIEKITDPLTHLVRNACDHGIEMPADRLARGKPEAGTVTLAASHERGAIVIEVRDDGRGLNRARLLAKARERGLEAPDTLSDGEVWSLIFAPGFSTAEQVTDVSGRGVGMDVVKKNITALGGSVDIESAEGRGMSVKVRLPLTLAILDSMSVHVAGETFILPLSSIVDSFRLNADQVRTVCGASKVLRVRDAYLPVLDVEQAFAVPRKPEAAARRPPVAVVVEADGARAVLLVDELIGQQQVVVKSLESHYGKVEHLAGATIMGDGSVALILDVGSLVRRVRH